MNKLLLIFFLIVLSSSVFATQTITDLNTNSPVPLNKTLTITGNFVDDASADSIFCKFVVRDEDNKVVERLSDERTYANGDFYAQRVIDEPLYKRGQDYNVSVDCDTTNSTVLFTVGQRESIGHTAEQETLFAFDRGNLDSILFFGSLIFVLIICFTIFIFWWNRAKGLWG